MDGATPCVDGDPTCDLDGAVDGGCTFSVAVCLAHTPGSGACTPVLRIGGRSADVVRSAAAGLALPDETPASCSAVAPVRVALGRRRRAATTLRAVARDAGVRRVARAALRLRCLAAPGSASPATAVVVTTDFETGRLATVRVGAPHAVATPDTPIHSDAVVRVLSGQVWVVNRYLGDNLQLVDPVHGLRTLLQCSTGPGSNPHDLVLAGPHKAYVTRFDRPELWIVDPGAAACGAFHTGTIDLSPWADADGIPEMDQMAVVGDRLFVTLERLDRTRSFAAAGKSLVAVIDTTSDAVVAAIELAGANAFGETAGLVREPGSGKLVVAEAGNVYRTGDGGLERVDPVTLTAEGFFVGEDALGGNVTDFVLLSPTKGYAVVIDDALRNALVAFDPTGATPVRRLLVRTQFLPEVALAPDRTLWLADRSLPAPGIRIFDTATDQPIATVDVGLPPFAMAFLP